MERIDDTNVIMTVMHLKLASALLKDYEEEISTLLLELANMLLSAYDVDQKDVDETKTNISSYDNIDETKPIS